MDHLPPPSPALLGTLVFCAALVAQALLRLWLASRQARAVATQRHAVPAAFAHAITPDAHAKAAQYTLARLRLEMAEVPLGAAVLLGWTLLGGLDWLNAWLLQTVGARALAQPLALLAAFSLIAALLDVPLALWRTFALEQRFGFNRTTWRLWLADWLKSALLGLAVGVPLAALGLWLMQAAGDGWWLWAWGLWVGFSLLAMLAWPTLVAPLFNRFEPLQDQALAAQVHALAARCGFAAQGGLFVMDGSRRSAHANAYFTGFGAARRVVLFDTLLARLAPAQVLAVLAHELGHFRHRHIARRMALVFALGFAALALLGWLARQPWFYAALGVAPNLPVHMGGVVPNHALALLLFMLAAPLAGFFATPLLAALSRRDEFEADAFAVRHSGAQALGSALVKLYDGNASTLTPDGLYARFYYSHPPAPERLARMGYVPQGMPESARAGA